MKDTYTPMKDRHLDAIRSFYKEHTNLSASFVQRKLGVTQHYALRMIWIVQEEEFRKHKKEKREKNAALKKAEGAKCLSQEC